MEHDTIITLPSGTEIDVASALGDLSRISERLLAIGSSDADGLASDALAVAELVHLLASDHPSDRDEA